MSRVLFYHLTQTSAEATAAILLTKAYEREMRVLVRGRDADRMARLDTSLWTMREDGFLPHGLAGGDFDADQPILIGPETVAAAGYGAVMCLDGAGVTANDVSLIQRAWILFDGRDPNAVQHARVQWKELTGAGVPAEYWSEDTGRWEKKAQSDG